MGPSSEGRLAAALELAATFLLEVLGGAGAVWGSSEFLGVRRGNNATAWRLVSGCVGLWCLLRWIGVHALGRERNASDEVLACFLLQVLGGAGAAWGCLEILGYRTHYPTVRRARRGRRATPGAGTPTRSAASSRWPSSWPSSPAGPASSGRSRRRAALPLRGRSGSARWRRAGSGARRRAAAAAAERAATFVLDVGGGGALWGAAASATCGEAGATRATASRPSTSGATAPRLAVVAAVAAAANVSTGRPSCPCIGLDLEARMAEVLNGSRSVLCVEDAECFDSGHGDGTLTICPTGGDCFAAPRTYGLDACAPHDVATAPCGGSSDG
ncbi:hypothetical protein JL721_3332 [Aureococcus anophagefferens]|nr:hypothetical protein JL721_3332 [Aureococcus anophagefferens]